jgi:hypothetical protein
MMKFDCEAYYRKYQLGIGRDIDGKEETKEDNKEKKHARVVARKKGV